MMNEIVLTGLREDRFPLSMLAALGLLRLSALHDRLSGLRLRWEPGPWRAVLCPDEPLDEEELIDVLIATAEDMTGRMPLFDPATVGMAGKPLKKLKMDSQWLHDYVDRLSQTVVTSPDDPWSRWRLDWAVSAASEPVDPEADVWKTRAFFDMTGGRQEFLKMVEDVTQAVADSPRSGQPRIEPRLSLTEALFGPWPYRNERGYHPLGWDAAFRREHARWRKRPAEDRKRYPPAGATWLAAQGTTLFPCAPVTALVRHQTAWQGHRARGASWVFPVWTRPLSLEAVRTLLALPTGEMRGLARERMGIGEVYRVARLQNSYYWVFGKPEPQMAGD